MDDTHRKTNAQRHPGLIEHLFGQLKKCGYRGRVVSISRLGELQNEIENRHKMSAFDETFYRQRLTSFTFKPPASLPQARSLIVVAGRDPQIRFTFTWNGQQVPLLVPPTYLHWQRADRMAENAIAEVLRPAGYKLAQMKVPEKLLAVCSGLAQYGKNNISYVSGYGSFHRIAVFCSDLPCPLDSWRKAEIMERCLKCSACLSACPSGAISSERFLLRAERCIVYHNEEPGEMLFPAWLKPSWHNCLVGCLLCQKICPENRECLSWLEEGAEFSQDETQLLVTGVPLQELPGPTAEKLKRWDLVDLLDIIPRNLKVLLDNIDSSAAPAEV